MSPDAVSSATGCDTDSCSRVISIFIASADGRTSSSFFWFFNPGLSLFFAEHVRPCLSTTNSSRAFTLGELQSVPLPCHHEYSLRLGTLLLHRSPKG